MTFKRIDVSGAKTIPLDVEPTGALRRPRVLNSLVAERSIAIVPPMSVREIARLARLSPSTVSLALRNSPKLAESTRRHVRAIAQRKGYHPNAKVVALMSQLRASRVQSAEACFGVVSFYDTPRPWEQLPHLTLIYEAMIRRAGELGYRLEPLWLRAPGMTYARARQILDARGIQGLLCFGGPEVDQEFPRELDHYAIVTAGQSLRSRLHRVTSHFFSDTWQTLDRVHRLGFRRPGLVLGHYEDLRSARACSSAYLGWCEQRPGPAVALPILRLEGVDEAPLLRWLREERPDVLVYAHVSNTLGDLREFFRRNKIRVPRQLSVAVVTQLLAGTAFAGMQQNHAIMGSRMVELLVSLIINLDIGFPIHPRIEMVESDWVEGTSLAKLPAAPRQSLPDWPGY
jgi:DNA-binding LacI/PurR family transcriptional regulator